MKKMIPFLLALLVLSGCGGERAPAETEVLPDSLSAVPEAIFLPETKVVEPISVPAVVTEGKPPAEDYDLASALRDPWSEENLYTSGGRLALLAEAPEGDAAFYTLPGTEKAGAESVLIQWGDSLAEFGWDFATPRRILPRLACLDLDHDGNEELIVICYVDSGTGVSIEDLHVLEKNDAGTLTDYALLYQDKKGNPMWEKLSSLLGLEIAGERAFVILGRELVEVNKSQLPEEVFGPSAGAIAQFTVIPGASFLLFQGSVNVGELRSSCVADFSAGVTYQDGVFTLWEFHLYNL